MKGLVPGRFMMEITDFSKCGVSFKKIDGKDWYSVNIRFPLVAGLQTADDEHVQISCQLQDSVVSMNHVMDFRSNVPSGKTRPIFTGVQQPEMKIAVYQLKGKGSLSQYAEELARDTAIEVGQDIQFRATVTGEGWNYLKLTAITVEHQRRSGPNLFDSLQKPMSSRRPNIVRMGASGGPGVPESIHLVLNNGCRNPDFIALAPNHPTSDSKNPMVISFNFKAFMFQDMMQGDALRINATVKACLDKEDCEPTQCVDGMPGSGRKRREARYGHNGLVMNGTHGPINDYNRAIDLRVFMPGYGEGTKHSSMPNDQDLDLNHAEQTCQSVIIASACLSALFAISTTLAAIVALRARTTMSVDNWSGQ
ncbi:hypothetical protein HDE_07227 [Halotydeus destructor]|nr:hypothetical protein HDE_07227 [Halotydeus destructor]